VDRAHAKHLQLHFPAAGVQTAYIDAFTSACERLEIERRFHSGEIKVVCNVGCLTTGIDWDVRCIILARPTKSEILFVQMIGRGLRTASGKDDCLVLYHSDSHLRLGFVTDIHYESLDLGRERQSKTAARREALPEECPKCTYIKPAKIRTCPACGFEPERQPNVEMKDGELVQIRGETRLITTAEKQHWYSQLLHIERSRGYKRGWAAHQYRQKFKIWPRGLLEVQLEPAPQVLNWIKSRLIAFKEKAGRMMGENTRDRARGMWRSILPALGISTRLLNGKHQPCPFCGWEGSLPLHRL
jgi:DNA repair protein RadD